MLNGKSSWTVGLLGVAALALLAVGLAWMLWPADAAQAQGAAGHEPADVRVVPGDRTLTVSWKPTSRPGVSDDQIRHALRWSQESGVWANPPCPAGLGRNDGFCLDGGVTQYVITGLKNDVPTGVFVRSFVGSNNSERNPNSSQWVRIKGDNTTPKAGQQQPAPQQTNSAPTVANAIGDATIVNESGTKVVSLTGVFADADGDTLTVTAVSSDEARATASVAADQSSLTVAGVAKGTATITVTANDGNGGTVEDVFTVTVKAAPALALPLSHIPELEAGAAQDVSLSGIFSDADGDALTHRATSSDDTTATVSVASDQSKLTVTGVAQGTATITVTAQDTDGNQASGAFDVAVVPAPQQQKQQAKSSDATLSGIAVYVATDHNPDNADNVLHDVTKALTVKPAVSAGVREYGAEMPEGKGYYVARANDGYYVAVSATPTAAAVQSIVIRGPESPLERRDPRDEVTSGEASGPWFIDIGYSLITIAVTSEDGANTEHYRLIIKRGEVDEPRGLRLAPGDGTLTLRWDANNGPAAPTHYTLRWRQAGETAWLNRATDGWRRYKTSYAADAPHATAADGTGLYPAASGSVELSGLDNGVAYEVQARGVRFHTFSHEVMNWLKSDWRSATGTPERPAATALTITPANPTREYGATDDLGYTVSGLVDGDAANDVVTGTLSRAAGNDAGSYAIGLGTLAIASDYARKYALPSGPAVTTYTITPKAITAIGGVTVNARASDGTTTATFDTSAAAGTGVLAAELADFRAGGLQVSGGFPAATPGTHDLSVTYALQDQGSFKAANYSLSATSATLQGELTEVAACGAALMLFADRMPEEGQAVNLIVALDGPIEDPAGVRIMLSASGTATTEDYTLSPNVLTIQAGLGARVATINVKDDTMNDPGETIIIDATAEGHSLQAGSLVLTIVDNDAQPVSSKPAVTPDCSPSTDGDYDDDNDGLIEICNRQQLDAIRWDLDGDGSGTNDYHLRFPGAAVAMGCPGTSCIGYELIADLDLAPASWSPIGLNGAGFAGVFEGNGHTISNLRLNCCDGYRMGLFHVIENNGVVRNLDLRDPHISRTYKRDLEVGALAGVLRGRVEGVRVFGGAISGVHTVGGLVGLVKPSGVVKNSYAQTTIQTGLSSGTNVGGLVGYNEGRVRSSFASGSISGAVARYAGGLVGRNFRGASIITSGALVDFPEDITNRRAGLVGRNEGEVVASYSAGRVGGAWGAGLIYENPGTVTDSYWDFTKSPRLRPQFNSLSGTSGPGIAKTTDELREVLGYSGIYANWNVDVDGDSSPDDPWDFGTACQYPIPKPLGVNPPGRGALCQVPAGLSELRLMKHLRDVNTWEQVGDNLIKDSTKTYYTVLLEENVLFVSLTPTAQRPSEAAITVDGETTASGGTVHISRPGPRKTKVVRVLVTEGGAERLYTVSLVREPKTDQQQGTPNRAPTVANALADVASLEVGATREVSLTGVFSDADGDSLTVTAASSNDAVTTATVASDGSKLTLTGVTEGTATVTVTAKDPEGNRVSDAFEVSVSSKYAALIAQMYQWRNGPEAQQYGKPHTDRWDRALLAFGETVADTSLTPMTADEAQAFADQGWERWVEVAAALKEIEQANQQGASNTPPTVASAIGDVTIVSQSGTRRVSMSGVFADADGDALTVTAKSSDTAKATVSVDVDSDGLTVAAKARGTATITVTASDGNGGTVDDAFTVTVKAAPTVASAIADASGLEAGNSQEVSLSGVFNDADGDSLTITAASSNTAKVTAAVASDGSKLTLTGVAEGNATVTVRAQDSDGNQASDAFEVSVAQAQQQAKPEGPEPWDIRIVPGDGILTVTWKVGSHDVDDAEVRHALRWSQEPGVWANPKDPNAGGPEDGVAMEGGVTSYVITGLKNDVPTGVFVRSFTGDSASERSPESSKWVRIKGDNTTTKGAQ